MKYNFLEINIDFQLKIQQDTIKINKHKLLNKDQIPNLQNTKREKRKNFGDKRIKINILKLINFIYLKTLIRYYTLKTLNIILLICFPFI